MTLRDASMAVERIQPLELIRRVISRQFARVRQARAVVVIIRLTRRGTEHAAQLLELELRKLRATWTVARSRRTVVFGFARALDL